MSNYKVIEYVEKDLQLEHHGILGMHWGIRRYQNKDGSLTPAGVERYGKKLERANSNINYAMNRRSLPKVSGERLIRDNIKQYEEHPSDEKKEELDEFVKETRQHAAGDTIYYDFYAFNSVFNQEIAYDNLASKIRDKYGDTSFEEVAKWMSDHLSEDGNRNFEQAMANRKEYEVLLAENDTKLDEIFKRK